MKTQQYTLGDTELTQFSIVEGEVAGILVEIDGKYSKKSAYKKNIIRTSEPTVLPRRASP